MTNDPIVKLPEETANAGDQNIITQDVGALGVKETNAQAPGAGEPSAEVLGTETLDAETLGAEALGTEALGAEVLLATGAGMPAWQNALSVHEQKTAAAAMFDYLKDVIYSPQSAKLVVEDLPTEFQDLGAGLLYVGQCLHESRTLANHIAKGNLETSPLTPGNELASGLKSLQATLKHLTWQIGQVAKGDYKQQVSFAGEFSKSINGMIRQLDERDSALRAEIEINKRKTEELLQSVRLFEAISEDIDQWIFVVDCQTREWLYNNHGQRKISHFTIGIEIIQDWLDRQVDLIDRSDWGSGGQHVMELSLFNGEDERCFAVVWYPVAWYEHAAYAFVMNDITEEKRTREELETIAFYDALTGSNSRHFGMNLLDKWLKNREEFVIAFVDIDNLKYVNDTYGHAEGDTYIITVAKLLRTFDENVVLCRLGGDEFMLLSLGWNKNDADERFEEMRTSLIENSNIDYQRSISYGVIEITKKNKNTGSYLLSIADEIMYEYKRARKVERRAGT
ncbi:MAG: GGDEF domain-containing protein [Coriobacteriia bacterium]|nr:GGDEF domain-containing protein [Coriobacteriia bacterium]